MRNHTSAASFNLDCFGSRYEEELKPQQWQEAALLPTFYFRNKLPSGASAPMIVCVNLPYRQRR